MRPVRPLRCCAAGLDASAAQSADDAVDGPLPGRGGAQLARVLGADLPGLSEVPAAVEYAFRTTRDENQPARPPSRLIEFIGGGINQWTAAEGALKIREAAYIASEGLGVEQFLHGPSVALGENDRLVCLDGGGAWSARIAEVAQAAEDSGVR